MQLVGQSVYHATFGQGVVTDFDQKMVSVSFKGIEKKFIYPDAFKKFLTVQNDDVKDNIQNALDHKVEKRKSKIKIMEREIEHKSLLMNMRIAPKSQAAFDILNTDSVFDSWAVSAGVYLSGYGKGEPRIPDRLKPNSMCLLTHRDEEQTEEERVIIGAFMVTDEFIGADCSDGVIYAHPTYRIQLEEGEKPLFWSYFAKEAVPKNWGRIPMKYFSNTTGETILYDIANHAKSHQAQKEARQFYHYYCKINRLNQQKFAVAEDKNEKQ